MCVNIGSPGDKNQRLIRQEGPQITVFDPNFHSIFIPYDPRLKGRAVRRTRLLQALQLLAIASSDKFQSDQTIQKQLYIVVICLRQYAQAAVILIFHVVDALEGICDLSAYGKSPKHEGQQQGHDRHLPVHIHEPLFPMSFLCIRPVREASRLRFPKALLA